jgi:hypothetical protein
VHLLAVGLLLTGLAARSSLCVPTPVSLTQLLRNLSTV